MLKSPSLSSLMAFVIVGKRKSFRRAADEMLLTAGAISLKIKTLEEQLGCKLLNRTSHAVTFTEKGELYYNAIAPLIAEITDVTQRLFEDKPKTTLVVSVTPSFALRWLLPRLENFHRDWPELTVNINSTERLIDFAADDVDLAIRHGLGTYRGLKAERMFPDDMVPVCSPRLLQTKSLNQAADLAQHTLLHDSLAKDWGIYLDAMEVPSINATSGPRFDSDTLVIQAAIEGHGVALARSSLVRREIERGNLVVPFDLRLPSKFAYYVVYPENRHLPPETSVFRDWLLRESALYMEAQ